MKAEELAELEEFEKGMRKDGHDSCHCRVLTFEGGWVSRKQL